MRRTIDITALGELLIDFTQNGVSGQGNPMFEANPGGAPCNVLALLQKLGFKTAFLGKVGDDAFGRILKERAEGCGIDMSGLFMDPDIKTTLAFVIRKPDGDRDFSFYRKPGADIMLTADEVLQKKELIRNSRVFHFGTLSMTDEPALSATYEAVSIAKEAGCVISFDPNYRAPLWESEDMAKERIAWGISQCDVMKIADNEITLMTGESDYDKGARMLLEKYNIPLLFTTFGSEGSRAYTPGGLHAEAAAYLNPEVADTTGAGDTFFGSILHFVIQEASDADDTDRLGWIRRLTPDQLAGWLRFANAAASVITTRKGAMCVMPEEDEILARMK